MTGEVTQICQRGMRPVQHADFHRLERRHIADKLHARHALQRGPRAIDKAVLDHPLAERLMKHRCTVLPPGGGRQRRDVLGLGRRHDPVHHCGGKARLGGNPIGEGRVNAPRQTHHHVPRHTAIIGQVVATQHRERAQTGSLAFLQRTHDAANRRDRERVGDVALNIGMPPVQRARAGHMAIPLFGHCQRHDADRRVSHSVHQRLRIFGRKDHVAQHVYHAGCATCRAHLDSSIGAVLRHQLVAYGRRAQADTNDAPIAARRAHRVFDDQRTVRAKERAKPQMDDPGPGRR